MVGSARVLFQAELITDGFRMVGIRTYLLPRAAWWTSSTSAMSPSLCSTT